MIFFIILFFVSLILILTSDRIRVNYLACFIKGPIAFPIVGNGFLAINKSSEDNFRLVIELTEKYGNIFRVWAGPQLMVVLNDPKYVETILSSSKHITKSYEYRMLSHWLKDGLLLSSGNKWLQRRKILTPAFHFSILEEYVDCFDSQSSILVDKLKKFGENEKFELYPLITLCALDMICETTMGTSLNAQCSDSKYARAVRDIANSMTNRFFNVFLRFNVVWQLSKQSRKQNAILKVLHEFTRNVIKDRRLKLNSMVNNPLGEKNDIGIKQKKAFIDILLNSTVDGKPLSDSDISEEVDTFMFEGHDTTTSATLFALYNIAKISEVQRKCFEELKTVFGHDKMKKAELSDLNNLYYLDMVIKETLRLFPSVPLVARHVTEEVRLYDGKIIPKDTDVVINLFCMGRSANLHSNPNEFRPERFEKDFTAAKTNPFTFTPFSAGPRNCIGQKFAVLELKSTISKILRHFEVSLADDTLHSPLVLAAEIILISKRALYFHVKERNYE